MINKQLDYYTELVLGKTPFSFSRYGDGEFNAIFGRPGENCDGHEYFTDLGYDLVASIKRKHQYPFHYARGVKGASEHGIKIYEWFAANKVEDILWYDCDVFLEASLGGRLRPFIDAINTRNTLYVGPAHLLKLTQIKKRVFIEIPLKNCYLEKNRLLWTLDATLESGSFDLVLFSCGMLSNVLIDELYINHSDITMIDIGSLFDVYAGVRSRKYSMSPNYNFDKLKVTNLGLYSADVAREEIVDIKAYREKLKEEKKRKKAAFKKYLRSVPRTILDL